MGTNLPATVVDAPVKVRDMERSLDELVSRAEKVREAQKRVMVKGDDYGVIPGTAKPTLLKPGAEKLCSLFLLRPEYEVLSKREASSIIHTAHCRLYHIPSGSQVGDGLGSCNNRERQYRKQDAWEIDNTLLKMACKRALVAAVLVATAASDVFSQDLEDAPKPRPKPKAEAQPEQPSFTPPEGKRGEQ